MQSVSPVWTEDEVELERVIALDQPQYIPIIVLPVRYSDGISGMVVRFRLSDEDRKAIADGADLMVSELTFGNPFTPISIQCLHPDERPK